MNISDTFAKKLVSSVAGGLDPADVQELMTSPAGATLYHQQMTDARQDGYSLVVIVQAMPTAAPEPKVQAPPERKIVVPSGVEGKVPKVVDMDAVAGRTKDEP